MGINGIIKLLQTHFEPCLREVPFMQHIHANRQEMKYNHVCLELNFKLHALFRSKTIRNQMFDDNTSDLNHLACHTMQQEVRAMQQVIFIKDECFIAMDGCAPLAKMVHQRKNRIMKNDIIHSHITPGTLFMNQFNNDFFKFLQRHTPLSKHRLKFSGSTEQGEGECKIFQYIQDEIYKIPTDEKKDVLVIGVDGDLILMGLLVNYTLPDFPCHNLEILFSNSSFRYYLAKYADAATNANKTAQHWVISISQIQQQFREIFQLKHCDTQSLKRISLDFAFFNLLIGNDYIPRILPSALKHYWTNYVQTKKIVQEEYMVNIVPLDESTFHFEVNIPFFLQVVFSDPSSTKVMNLHQKVDSVEAGRNQVIEYFQMLNWNLQSMLQPQVTTLHSLYYRYEVAPSASLIEEAYHFYGKDLFTSMIQVDLKKYEIQPLSMEQYLVGIMPKFAELYVPEHVRPYLTDEMIQKPTQLLHLIQNIN